MQMALLPDRWLAPGIMMMGQATKPHAKTPSTVGACGAHGPLLAGTGVSQVRRVAHNPGSAGRTVVPYPSNGGKIRSKTSGQCCRTISLESELLLQTAAYRSAD